MMEISSNPIWYNNQEVQLIKSLNSASLISITDPKGIIIYANDKFCKITGYDEQELLGQNHRILKSGKHPDSLFKDMWTAISSKKMWRGELCNKRKDGSFYWATVTIVPFTDKHGKIDKYVAIRFDITKNQENIEALKKLKNNFSSIFNSANDAIFIVDIDTRKIINANKKATELLGYTKSELIGMLNYNLYPKKNTAFIKKQGEKLIANNNILFETQQIHKNGTVIDVEISSKIFNDGTQEVFQSIIRDITLRKETEAKLIESELNKNLIIENTPYCIHRLDQKGIIQSMNSTGLKMLNLTKEEVIGRNYIDFFNDNLKSKINKLLNKALKGEGSEFEFQTNAGQTWESSFIPIITKNEDTKLLGITLDITEKRKKELAIVRSEEKFKFLFNAAPDAYFISDMNGVIVNCNIAAEKMSGYTINELINKSMFESPLISKTDSETLYKALKIPSKKPYDFELTVNTKQGKKINVELISHRVIIDGENLILNIAHDITTRKINHTKLKEKTEELELFLYRSSHDLRSPYTSLEGLVNLIKQEPLNESTLELINLFEQTLNSGKILVDNLATASEIINETIKNENIDLNKLIKKIINTLKYIEGFKNISFNINIPKTFNFYSNQKLLSSILKNLLQNAIKYKRPLTAEHTPFIIITALKTKKGINISIKDNGMGIKKDEVDKIFDLYYRSNTTVDGTGLGLYITKNAVKKLNGTISATSIVNMETQFNILLPNLSKA